MTQNLNNENQESQILKHYRKLLESTNFEVYKIEHDSKTIQIFADIKNQLRTELYLNINHETKIVNEIALNQLAWRKHLSLTLPGQKVQLEITGGDETDFEQDLNLNIIKTETNVKVTDLVITIKSMLQEIQNAEASLK